MDYLHPVMQDALKGYIPPENDQDRFEHEVQQQEQEQQTKENQE